MTAPAGDNTYSPFRWYIMVTMVFVVATQAIALISPASLVPTIAQTLPELSLGQVTFLTMGTWNLVLAISTIGCGFILEKVGFTRLYMIGLVLMGLGWLLMPVLGDTGTGLGLARCTQALGAGPVMAAGVYVAATCFPPHERNLITGIFGFAMSVGIAAGLAIVPSFLASTGDWRRALSALWIFPAIALVLTIIAYFGLRRSGMSELASSTVEVDATGHARSMFTVALKSWVTWVAVGCVLIAAWLDQAFNDMVPGYLAAPVPAGLDLGPESGRLVSLAMFGQMAGALPSP